MISGIQLIAILFSFFMLYVTFIHYKKRALTILEGIVFGFIWIASILVIIFSRLVETILEPLKIYRILDLATILGFMFLIGLTFSNYLEVKSLKKKIELIVRDRTLKKANKK